VLSLTKQHKAPLPLLQSSTKQSKQLFAQPLLQVWPLRRLNTCAAAQQATAELLGVKRAWHVSAASAATIIPSDCWPPALAQAGAKHLVETPAWQFIDIMMFRTSCLRHMQDMQITHASPVAHQRYQASRNNNLLLWHTSQLSTDGATIHDCDEVN
jgi:hypothetical protein